MKQIYDDTPEPPNKYQVIILTLSDGRQVRATVPAFWDGQEELEIASFEVTEARELPPDIGWGPLFDEVR